MDIKIKGKTLLVAVLIASGVTFGEYISVISAKSSYIVGNSTGSSTSVYSGTDNKEVAFPIGHTIVGWVGNGYVQSNLNQKTKIYLVTDVETYPRYASDWYGAHSSEVYLEGMWQYRGYVGSMGNVSTGMFVRVE